MANIIHRHRVLQEHISQDIRARAPRGDTSHAQSRQRINEVMEDEIHWIQVEPYPLHNHRHDRGAGVARREERAVHPEVDCWWVEGGVY